MSASHVLFLFLINIPEGCETYVIKFTQPPRILFFNDFIFIKTGVFARSISEPLKPPRLPFWCFSKFYHLLGALILWGLSQPKISFKTYFYQEIF